MRVLFTTLNGAGHFHPLVPLAHALRAAGHDVAFASLPPFCPTIERAGFPAFAAGFSDVAPQAGVVGTILAAFSALPEAVRQRQQAAFAASPETGVWWVIGNIFAGFLTERSVPDLLTIAGAWHPDLVIRESFEFGGYLAAEALGVPHVAVQNSTFPPDDGRLDEMRRVLNERRSALGLPSDPAMGSLHRYLCLSPAPPAYHDPMQPPPPTLHPVRLEGFDRVDGTESVTDAVLALPDRPVVYATVGTEQSRAANALLREIVAAMAEEPVVLIVTVGRHRDPAEFGPQPPHIRIERYIPQSLLLPRCDLVVTHGGWNTVLDALRHGLPLVVLPMGNDQPLQARRCAALGVGQVLWEGERGAEAIRTTVRDVLTTPTYREQASRLQREMAALPRPEHAVELLERLARERQPLIAG